jgi:hypothetical protein
MSERTAKLEQASRDAVKRRGQSNALAALFREHVGELIGLPKVMEVGGCQYSARIHFLRHALGLRITSHRKDGKSFFRLERSVPLSRRDDVLEDCEIKQQIEAAVQKDGEHEAGFLFSAEPLSYRDPEEDAR